MARSGRMEVRLNDALQENEKLRNQVRDLQKKNEEQLPELQRQKDAVESQLREAQSQKDAVESQLRELQSQKDALEREVQRQKDAVESQLRELQSQKDAFEREVQRQKDAFESQLREKCNESKRDAASNHEKMRVLAQQKEILEQHIKVSFLYTRFSSVSLLQSLNEEATRKEVALKDNLKTLGERNEQQLRQLEKFKAVRQSDQTQIDKLTAKMTKVEEVSRSHVKELQKKCETLENERDTVRSDKEKLQIQCTTQLTLIAQQEATCSDARAQIKALKQKMAKEADNHHQELQKLEADLGRAQEEVESKSRKFIGQREALQQEINCLTARLQQYEDNDSTCFMSDKNKAAEAQEMIMNLRGHLEMASRTKAEQHLKILNLEQELRKCYAFIENQKKTFEEERVRNLDRRITALEERNRPLTDSCVENNFSQHAVQKVRSQSLPEAVKHSVSAPDLLPIPPSDGEVFQAAHACPICNRQDFRSVEELVLHCAKCSR